MRRLAPLVLLAVAAPLLADEPKEIIERAAKAHGGVDNLERCTASRTAFVGRPQEGGPAMTMSGTWAHQAPDRQKISLQMTIGEQRLDAVLVLAGGKGWQKFNIGGGAQDQEFPEERRRQ